MAFSTALSQALNRKIRTSGVQSVKGSLGTDRMAKLQDAYNSQDMYDLNGNSIKKISTFNPTTWGQETVNPNINVNAGVYSPQNKMDYLKSLGYDTSNIDYSTVQNAFSRNSNGGLSVDQNKLSSLWLKTSGNNAFKTTDTTGIPSGDATLADYEKNLWITAEDKAKREQLVTDLSKANEEAGKYNASDYYNELVTKLWRDEASNKLSELQNQQARMESGVNLQENEVSTGNEWMLSQARQNEFRARPLRDQLSLNIAQQNVQQNKISGIDSQIQNYLNLRSADLDRKTKSIQASLDALKGKVPDYMLNYANAQLNQKLQDQATMHADLLKNGDINSDNPALKKKAIQNMVNSVYSQYAWMPFSQTAEQHVEDIYNWLQSGKYKDVNDAINQNLVAPLQSKSEYKQWQYAKGLAVNPQDQELKNLQIQKAKQELANTGKDYQITTIKNADGSETTVAINKNNPTDKVFINWNWNIESSQASISSIKSLSSRLTWNNVQCGMVSNDYAKNYFPDAPKMWDSYDSKVATIESIGESNVPQAGWLFVMDTWKYTWHTWVVTSVNLENWTFTVTEANKNGSTNGWPVTSNTYKISDKFKFSVAPSAPQYDPDALNYFNLIQKGTTTYDNVFKKLWWSKAWQKTMESLNKIISEKWGSIPALPDSPQVKKMDDVISRLDNLSKNDEMIEDVSWFYQFSPWDSLTNKKQDTLSDIQFILDGWVLQNLIDAKAQGATFGALSEAELRMLQSSSNVLAKMAERDAGWNIVWFRWSEDKVKSEIKKLLDLYKEKKEKMINVWGSVSSSWKDDTFDKFYQ